MYERGSKVQINVRDTVYFSVIFTQNCFRKDEWLANMGLQDKIQCSYVRSDDIIKDKFPHLRIIVRLSTEDGSGLTTTDLNQTHNIVAAWRGHSTYITRDLYVAGRKTLTERQR